jgi:hypothetical protein
MHSRGMVASELVARTSKSSRMVFAGLLVWILVSAFSLPLHAQPFAPISPLFFTKPFGGADPLPQTLTVAATGTDFQYGASFSTNSGGSWLSVALCSSNVCSTPHPMTVTVTASPALAAGTYTG